MITLQLKSSKDVKSFRLTCKRTNRALATEVLRRITVNVNKETFEKELCKLRYLAEGCCLIQGIRQVDIKSLSPDLDPYIEWPSLDTKRGAASEEEELRKCLYNTLSSLKNVRTVRCVFHELFLHTIFTNFPDNLSTDGHQIIKTKNGLKLLPWMPLKHSTISKVFTSNCNIAESKYRFTFSLHCDTYLCTTVMRGN